MLDLKNEKIERIVYEETRKQDPSSSPRPFTSRYRPVFCTECGGRDEFDCLCIVDEEENEHDPFEEPLVCDFCDADTIYECTCEPHEEIRNAIFLPNSWTASDTVKM